MDFLLSALGYSPNIYLTPWVTKRSFTLDPAAARCFSTSMLFFTLSLLPVSCVTLLRKAHLRATVMRKEGVLSHYSASLLLRNKSTMPSVGVQACPSSALHRDWSVSLTQERRHAVCSSQTSAHTTALICSCLLLRAGCLCSTCHGLTHSLPHNSIQQQHECTCGCVLLKETQLAAFQLILVAVHERACVCV